IDTGALFRLHLAVDLREEIGRNPAKPFGTRHCLTPPHLRGSADGGACRPHVIEDTRQWIGLDLKPLNARITPPPTQLPARVAPIRARHGEWKLFESQLTAYVRERFRVTDAGQHGGRGWDTCVERG